MLTLMILLATARARDLNALYTRAKFTVGSAKIEAFVADDDQRRANGLMQIKRLGPNEGMLFVFDEPQRLRFWMKDTLIKLSIGFFDAKCTLMDKAIEMDVAPSVLATDLPTYQSPGDAVFALEMNEKWFEQRQIPRGAKLRLDGQTGSPQLRRAFARCK